VLVAFEDALLFQGADVLEDRHFAGAELVGELLHGRRVAVDVTVVTNGDDDIQTGAA